MIFAIGVHNLYSFFLYFFSIIRLVVKMEAFYSSNLISVNVFEWGKPVFRNVDPKWFLPSIALLGPAARAECTWLCERWLRGFLRVLGPTGACLSYLHSVARFRLSFLVQEILILYAILDPDQRRQFIIWNITRM